MTIDPSIVSALFILTTFAAIGFLLHAVKRIGLDSIAAKLLIFILPLWLFFQAILALGEFYLDESSIPPRILLTAILPALFLIGLYLIVFRKFVDRLSLRVLTILHIVRIPVEIVLYLLAEARLVPVMMTFHGLNYDILSGLAAPVIYWLAFKKEISPKAVLISYNLIGLLLLANIVSIAILSLPSPLQRLNFDQPDRAIQLFPYIWLPAIVVPIVLFSHLASLRRLFTKVYE